MKKVVAFILLFLITMVTVAQNGYRIEIKQVFPKSLTVYSNVFNFKREMDNAISIQTAKLSNNGNYQILITTPSGKETRNIQNINWVQTVNGVRSYHKKQTSPNRFYDAATIWEGSACNIDGSRKGKTVKKEFVCRVAFADSLDDYKSPFVDLAAAEAEASRLFEENVTDERLVEVVIFKFENDKRVECNRKSNKEQHERFVTQKIINDYKTAMDTIHEKKDSLKIIGVETCWDALNKLSIIPDSFFISQKLDSIYLAVLFNDIVPENEIKDPQVKAKIDEMKNQQEHTVSKYLQLSKDLDDVIKAQQGPTMCKPSLQSKDLENVIKKNPKSSAIKPNPKKSTKKDE